MGGEQQQQHVYFSPLSAAAAALLLHWLQDKNKKLEPLQGNNANANLPEECRRISDVSA